MAGGALDKALAEAGGADRQLVRWRPAAWRERLPEFVGLFDQLSEGDDGGAEISRRTMYDHARRALEVAGSGIGPLRESFVVTMIWGRGLDNRGPGLTKKMITSSGFDAVLAELVLLSTTKREEPEKAFSALFSNRRTRIPRLAVAFGTKVPHSFGCADNGVQPVVYDRFVYEGLRKLSAAEDARSVPTPTHPWRFMASSSYGAICRWVAEEADRRQLSPKDIGYGLFLLGRESASA
jgi:hypothetical protein